MQLTTPVTIPPSSFSISHQTPLLLLGSCFSDEIGQRIATAGLNCLCNPFGTLYNPLSIAACLRRAIFNQEIDRSHLVQQDGLWHSWLHHGRFSHPDPDKVLHDCNQSIHLTHQFLSQQPVILCTFGTAYAFFLRPDTPNPLGSDEPVANCHKVPPSAFLRRRLSTEEIVDCWRHITAQLSDSHFIFTVSPIRHLADGAHGNQLSKSTLLLSLDTLVGETAHTEYFGSYEILLDELRDYRFYAKDMTHPSELSVDIIWERFQQTYMSPDTVALCRLHKKEWRRLQHRPLHPQGVPTQTPQKTN